MSIFCFISFLYLDLYVLGDDTSISCGSVVRAKHICVKLRVVLLTLNMFKHSTDFSLVVLFAIYLC